MTREEAIAELTCILNHEGEYMDYLSESEVEAIKTLAVERPHGEWLSHYDYCKKHGLIPSGLIAFWWCNQCKQGVEIQTNFCPNCGASMQTTDENTQKHYGFRKKY